MPASRADLLRPMPSLTDVRNRTPAADEELRCMSNHLVNKALLRPIEPGHAHWTPPSVCLDRIPVGAHVILSAIVSLASQAPEPLPLTVGDSSCTPLHRLGCG